jgi:hypothetical protein
LGLWIFAPCWGRLAGTLEVGDLAVLTFIAIAAYKLARTTNKSDPLLWAIAAAVCAVTAISRPAHHQARAAPARATD